MKLKNILFYLFIFGLMCVQIWAQNTNPIVSNVVFSISGTTVTVTYDVSDAQENSFTVYMEVSSDGGTTWDYDYGSATGDIGTSISDGTGKTITWTYSGGYADNFKIKILADDLYGDQIYYSGKIYNTVEIGTQVWLKENLDIGTRIDASSAQSDNSIIEKYCYDDLESNCDIYGGLYQWNEAMQYSTTEGTQGICPVGWHMPTLAEFTTLSTSVGDNGYALLAEGQGNGTNSSGFSGLLAGSYAIEGFDDLGVVITLWSSTENNATHARNLDTEGEVSVINWGSNPKTEANNVRCLKD
jgi:uncharacterized protein (TIGR02145 family)